MREQPLNDTNLHPVLADLPAFEPDAQLWPRIVAAHARRRDERPRRRWLAGAGIAAAAAAVVIAALVVAPRRNIDSPSIAAQRESQALEREWQSLPAAGSRPAADLARLHVIDTALQSAYDRGAEADELGSLWKQRNDALRGLILTARADTVTRI
jgi:hypothetical protein